MTLHPRTDVIIVGAPRSGTNMLRDVLTSFAGVATWPCDEINLIWRHGNRDQDSDELTGQDATEDVSRYVRRAFDRVAQRYDAAMVVEKTCANSLRADFVRAVMPEAKYILITRDGVDAAASAMDRWHAPLDLAYSARKARFVPPSDLAYYGARFLLTAARRHRSRRASRPGLDTWWGPRPHDYRDIMASSTLAEATALQWQRCVIRARSGLADLPPSHLLHVVYEDFVRDPVAGLREIAQFLGLPGHDLEEAVAKVSRTSVGKGRATLGPEQVAHLDSLIGGTLSDLGYER